MVAVERRQVDERVQKIIDLKNKVENVLIGFRLLSMHDLI